MHIPFKYEYPFYKYLVRRCGLSVKLQKAYVYEYRNINLSAVIKITVFFEMVFLIKKLETILNEYFKLQKT